MPVKRTGWMVIDADGAMNERRAATASGTPMEWPPPSTSETVGLDMPAIRLGDGQPRLHIAPGGVEQHQQPVHLIALLHRGQLGIICSYFGGLGILRQDLVPLNLAGDGDAVDDTPGGFGGDRPGIPMVSSCRIGVSSCCLFSSISRTPLG